MKRSDSINRSFCKIRTFGVVLSLGVLVLFGYTAWHDERVKQSEDYQHYMEEKQGFLKLGYYLEDLTEATNEEASFESICTALRWQFPDLTVDLEAKNPFPSILTGEKYDRSKRIPGHEASKQSPFLWTEVRLPQKAILYSTVGGDVHVLSPVEFDTLLTRYQ